MKYQMINEVLLLNRSQKIWLHTLLHTLSQIDLEVCNQLKQRYATYLEEKDLEALDQRQKEQLLQLRRIE